MAQKKIPSTAANRIDCPRLKAGTIGPYPERKNVRIISYSYHRSTGAGQMADFQFFFEAVLVNRKHDTNFDVAHFDFEYDLFLDAGSTAHFCFVTTNDHASEIDFGFNLLLSPHVAP